MDKHGPASMRIGVILLFIVVVAVFYHFGKQSQYQKFPMFPPVIPLEGTPIPAEVTPEPGVTEFYIPTPRFEPNAERGCNSDAECNGFQDCTDGPPGISVCYYDRCVRGTCQQVTEPEVEPGVTEYYIPPPRKGIDY